MNCICCQLEGYVVLKESKSFIVEGTVNESGGEQQSLFNDADSGS